MGSSLQIKPSCAAESPKDLPISLAQEGESYYPADQADLDPSRKVELIVRDQSFQGLSLGGFIH